MVYGILFFGYAKLSVQDQRDNVSRFAIDQNFKIDKYISLKKNLEISAFKSGDTLVCYSWACLGGEYGLFRKIVRGLIDKNVCLYSVTGTHCVDTATDFRALKHAFDLYEDMRFSFLSNKNAMAAKTRVINGNSPGRPIGAKNHTRILDGKEHIVFDMRRKGFSMHAIAKKLNASAPTIKRFLAASRGTNE